MKAYITKYALTSGILEKDVEICEGFPKMVRVLKNSYSENYHKPFWYESREEAVEHAEKIRVKKLLSIEKEVKKIKGLKF